jgi:hypothetical protein
MSSECISKQKPFLIVKGTPVALCQNGPTPVKSRGQNVLKVFHNCLCPHKMRCLPRRDEEDIWSKSLLELKLLLSAQEAKWQNNAERACFT